MSDQFPKPPLVYVGQRHPQETQISLVQETADGIHHKNIVDLQQLIRELTKPEIVSWVNVVGLKNIEIINELCDTYNIHPLVIEDILHTEQMPKVDIFDDYLYIVIRVPTTTRNNSLKDGSATFNQVSLIIMKNLLLTFQEEDDESFSLIQRQCIDYLPKTRRLTVDFILYSLFDAVLESYFTLSDHESDLIESFEDKLIKNPQSLALPELYKLKCNLLNLRKVVQPTRDIVSILSRQGPTYLQETTHVYFNDLYDHCLRLSEQLDGYRDMLTSMLEIYRSSVNNKLNESMKTLTIIATIFIPITFVVSLFSMNFRDQPLLNVPHAFNYVVGIIVAVVIGMLVYFRFKKWV